MKRYMLDTNTVSHLLKGKPQVVSRITRAPMESLCISAITEAELLFGIAKRPEATRLHTLVDEFLLRIEVLPWDSIAAAWYGKARAVLEARGKVIAPLDLLIASHALSRNLKLVTNDKSFKHHSALITEDWSI